MNEDKVLQKLEQHDEQFKKADEQFNKVFVKFEEHDQQFDRVINKLIEHDDKLEKIEQTMFTKADGERLLQAIDGLTLMVKKIHEDHVFALEWLKRLQDKVDEQDKRLKNQEEEIMKLKMKLQIA